MIHDLLLGTCLVFGVPSQTPAQTSSPPAPAAAEAAPAPPAADVHAPTAPTTAPTPTMPAKGPRKSAKASPSSLQPPAWLAPVGAKTYDASILTPRKGRIVVVNFWASWCGPCLEEIPALLSLARERSDVDVVFISVEDAAHAPHAKEALAKKALAFESWAIAGDEAEGFAPFVDPAWQGEVPHTVMYAKNGQRALTFAGGRDLAAFRAAVDTVATMNPQAPSEASR